MVVLNVCLGLMSSIINVHCALFLLSIAEYEDNC